jgi:hypothetical protein
VIIQKKGWESLRALFPIATLVLLFYIPLNAEDKREKDDKTLIKCIASKFSLYNINPVPLETYYLNNSDLLPKEIKELKAYPIRLNLSLKGEEAFSILKKNFDNPNISRRTKISLFEISVLTLTALNVADFYSTKKALNYEGLKEANPLLRPLVKNTFLFAAVKFGITAFDYYVLKKLYKKDKNLAWLVSITSNIVMGYIVIRNFRLIKRAQI